MSSFDIEDFAQCRRSQSSSGPFAEMARIETERSMASPAQLAGPTFQRPRFASPGLLPLGIVALTGVLLAIALLSLRVGSLGIATPTPGMRSFITTRPVRSDSCPHPSAPADALSRS